MAGPRGDPNTIIVPAASLERQPWWPLLHDIIIAAFLHKPENVTVFPPDWKRLPDDPAIAARSLASELGDRGHLMVLIKDETPLACAGVLPYRGDNWINDAQIGKADADIANNASVNSADRDEEWEVCCFCVSLSSRRQGLSHHLLGHVEAFIRERGAKRLFTNYAEVETGSFWPRMGFEVIPGAGGVLKKGFRVHPDKEGLRDDIVFKMAVKTLAT